MSNHSILAPSRGLARRLAEALSGEGFHARATNYGPHHVVLAVAPRSVVKHHCIELSIVAGS